MKRILKGLTRSSGRKATVVAAAAMLLAALALVGPAWAVVISNPGSISIPSQGQATPYPATVNVSGLSGTITDLNVSLKGVSHTFPDDIEALLVGPGGQKVMLMSDVGGGGDLNGVDLTFDDEAAGGLPDSAQMRTGTYKPTRGTGSISMAAPAPAGPYGTSLTAFDGADPNGTYSLYVVDDAKNDSGQISGGFSVDITTGSGPPQVDTTPPETTIDSGPNGVTNSTSANLSFSSNEAGSTFQCSLDGGLFTACASTQTYSGLSEGSHTFQVKAADTAENTDATPADRTWSVDAT